MKRFGLKIAIAIMTVILFGLTWISCASGGDSSDPILSLSFLNNRVSPNVMSEAEVRINNMGGVSFDSLNTKRNEALGKLSAAGLVDAAADRVRESLQYQGKYFYYADTMREVTLQKDDVLSGAAGTQVMLRRGTATVINNSVIDVTNGTLKKAGSGVPQNTRHLIPAKNWSGVRVTSDSATVLVQGFYRINNIGYKEQYVAYAQALKVMGLFKGTNVGFELGKSATRAEAVTMLVRLLGEESAAQSGRHPFTDVPDWAKGYVGHAYTKGYTKGTSATKFTPNTSVTATQYMTFLLRALGYSDTAGDFSWDTALSAAVKLGVITNAEKDAMGTTFRRDQMVYLSYRALMANRKGSGQTLLGYLQEKGVVSAADAAEAQRLIQ